MKLPQTASHAANSVVDVLVVEDDDSLRLPLVEILSREGYVVRWASDGRIALAWLANHPVRLVVTDIFMPNCDGLEIIMKTAKKLPQTRFLAISGGGMTNNLTNWLKAARSLGCHRTLAKPFSLHAFLSVVQELLNASDPDLASHP